MDTFKIIRMKYLLSSIIFFCITKSTSGQISYQISGTLRNLAKTYIYLNHDISKNKIDSVFSENGDFMFNKSSKYPDLLYISVAGKSGRIPIFVSAGKIHIEASADSLGRAIVSGSSNHDFFKLVNRADLMGSFTSQEVTDYRKAVSSKDTVLQQSITKKVNERTTVAKKIMDSLLNRNPSSHVWSHHLASIRSFPNNPDHMKRLWEMYKRLARTVRKDDNGKLFVSNYKKAISSIRK